MRKLDRYDIAEIIYRCVLIVICFFFAAWLAVDCATSTKKALPTEACLAARVSVQDTIASLNDPTEPRAIFAQRGRRLLARVTPCVNVLVPSVKAHLAAVDQWNLEAYRDESYGYRELAARLTVLLDDFPVATEAP